jgi:hypothetical protein
MTTTLEPGGLVSSAAHRMVALSVLVASALRVVLDAEPNTSADSGILTHPFGIDTTRLTSVGRYRACIVSALCPCVIDTREPWHREVVH